ncbi:unnamed protein product [Blepharisma stoltei]|uniref:SHSP domain-containing protein n=1 Tax=Blepharisma stoltei TaxID=1481888 RepID=A0AAU9IBU7_9CILI|nr:unnamed protein product [Blepharisma stoltei]
MKANNILPEAPNGIYPRRFNNEIPNYIPQKNIKEPFLSTHTDNRKSTYNEAPNNYPNSESQARPNPNNIERKPSYPSKKLNTELLSKEYENQKKNTSKISEEPTQKQSPKLNYPSISQEPTQKQPPKINNPSISQEQPPKINNPSISQEQAQKQPPKFELPSISQEPAQKQPPKIDRPNISEDIPYDCVVNVGLVNDITDKEGKGWPIIFSNSFYETLEAEYKNPSLEENKGPRNSSSSLNAEDNFNSYWSGAVVAIVGLYDKGKTFVLNKLTESTLPSSKKVHTEGLSFKHVTMDGSTNIILLDTAGSFSPVKIENENSITLKEQAESFILDTVFELSDYFICVVNDFTFLDQRFLDKITISLQNTPKNRFKEVIVIHNFKDVTEQEEIDDLWKWQVTQLYPGHGNASQITRVTTNSANGEFIEKDVKWFKTEFTRHVYLANCNSQIGQEINPWTFALLKNWLKSIFIPVDKSSSVTKSVINNIQEKLRHYYDSSASVQLEHTNDRLKKIIKSTSSSKGRTTYQQIESSPFIIVSPNKFMPLIEIIEDRGEYKIFMEIPGLSKEDITIKRHNLTTFINGMKKRQEEGDSARIVQSQRKFGNFEIPFKIPEEYNRRWDSYEIKDGILTITYKKDVDD